MVINFIAFTSSVFDDNVNWPPVILTSLAGAASILISPDDEFISIFPGVSIWIGPTLASRSKLLQLISKTLLVVVFNVFEFKLISPEEEILISVPSPDIVSSPLSYKYIVLNKASPIEPVNTSLLLVACGIKVNNFKLAS